MRIGGAVLVMLVAMSLSGCIISHFKYSGTQKWLGQTCQENAEELVSAADWTKARTVNMRVRQGEYQPMILAFGQGKPYVLRIENADDISVVFRAGKFFEATAPKSLLIGDKEHESCISAFYVGPGEFAEFRFVAVRDGRYDFANNEVPFDIMFGGAAAGTISIQ